MALNEQQKQAIINAPKKFCEGSVVLNNHEAFIMGLTCGGQVELYGMTPENAKRIAKSLSKMVEEFEKKFREVEDTPEIVSPIQIDNLGGSGNKPPEERR